MARLIVHPRERATTSPDVFHITDPRDLPPDERPKVISTERLWKRTGQLAYGAGVEVPEDELPDLIGDAVHQARMRGDSGDSSNSRTGNGRSKPARNRR